MLVIQIPSNHIEEREYAIGVVFNWFLGVDYSIERVDINKTIIRFKNNSIEFPDSMWGNYDELDYLSPQNIPVVVRSLDKYNVPVLYGDGIFELKDNYCYCGVDIFAAVFFMLTRWEEYVNPCYDESGRFIGRRSVAYQSGFLNRPIVNEYIEMVWDIMKSLGYNGQRKKRFFDIVPTHDIDHPYMRNRFLRTTKQVIKSLTRFDFDSVGIYLNSFTRDPFDNYPFFMDISEAANLKSHFYFMSASPNTEKKEKRPYSAKRLKMIVSSIRQRGHIIGFHPGFFSTESPHDWKKEKDELESIIGGNVLEGRQHYLKFAIPCTFELWENNAMHIDSSLSYHDVEGFRCGTGDMFPVFNFLKRERYNVFERPLILMDATLTGYQKYSIEKISNTLDYYFQLGRKFKMPITILFHNSSFWGPNGIALKNLYRSKLLEYSAKGF